MTSVRLTEPRPRQRSAPKKLLSIMGGLMDLMVDGLAPNVRTQQKFYDLIVVGAGPAGTSAAICAAGEGIDTLIIEAGQAEGGAGFIECIDDCSANPRGITMAGWTDLTGRGGRRYLLNVQPGLAVTAFHQKGDHYQVETNQGHLIGAKALILAPGLRRRMLNVPGEQKFQEAGVHTCASCEGPAYAGKDVVVIGAGNSGTEQALTLAAFAKSVTVVEQGARVTGGRDLYQKAKTQLNITFKFNCIVREFKGDQRLTSVLVEDVRTGAFEELYAAAAFTTIGLEPATAAFQSSVDVDQRGFIKTGRGMQTSLAGVFAAGHARTSRVKRAEDAANDGYKAAMLVVKYLDKKRQHQEVVT
jgi:thioredoxin reductase (NADPH)